MLYPSSAAEDDYDRLGECLGADVVIDLVHTTVGEDAHRTDALRDTGNVARLLEEAAPLRIRGVAAVMWACTSGSFVFGLDGARDQARMLERSLGVPASSTSLAFVAALRALRHSRVALAATYPPDVTEMLRSLLADAGFEVVVARSLDILTGAEVGGVEADRVRELVLAVDDPRAEAILVPDTALHTIAVLPELERAVGKPVLTANQVTGWQALQLARAGRSAAGLGSLFDGRVTMREDAVA